MAETIHKEGLVVRTTGSWYNVLLSDGTVVECRLRGNFRIRGSKQTNPIAVGDRVAFQLLDDGTGMITDIADRRNCIIRRSTNLSKQTHVIAANIDLLCLVATLGFPRTSTGFIDRMLATAEAYHIPAVIIFNKCDLYGAESEESGKRKAESGKRGTESGERKAESEEGGAENELWQIHNEIKAIYEDAGYPVFEASALTGMGIDRIRQLIAGKTCLFTGHSGVGKSALLNAIDPTLHLRTGEVSEWSLKGKHTTTFAEIFPIDLAESGKRKAESGKWKAESGKRKAESGEHCNNSTTQQLNSPTTQQLNNSTTQQSNSSTYLIDTPGIKEFGMVDFQPWELSHFFPEMRSRLQDCRFATCTHRHEPGCAIKQAVENGEISDERYRNYLNILESIESDAPIRR